MIKSVCITPTPPYKIACTATYYVHIAIIFIVNRIVVALRLSTHLQQYILCTRVQKLNHKV